MKTENKTPKLSTREARYKAVMKYNERIKMTGFSEKNYNYDYCNKCGYVIECNICVNCKT